MLTRAQLASRIDHTLLRPEATQAQVEALCAEAEELGVYAVCVSPSRLPLRPLHGVAVCTVVGFPSGAHPTAVKAAEAEQAARLGAQEVDMVVDLGRVKAGDWGAVEADVAAVAEASGPDALLKVILETAALTRDEIVQACRASERGGAQYVKTSTGFHPAGGASVEAVRLLAGTVGGRLGVKASGGIRDTATALSMLEAGATRLGLSGSRAVLDGLDAAS
jgi:deoxyribose-phosphate aldolase